MLFQPFRNFEGIDGAQFARNIERARRKFDLMGRAAVEPPPSLLSGPRRVRPGDFRARCFCVRLCLAQVDLISNDPATRLPPRTFLFVPFNLVITRSA
jgi:hypothetical protein